MKVLIVDDNPDNIELICDVLHSTGHELLTAINGYEAIKLADEQLPDLILLDINMPGLSGFEVSERLRNAERTANIPIIMVTALADIDSRVQGIKLGADDYLTKPFSPRELLARVQRRLENKRQTDEIARRQLLVKTTFERYVAASVVEAMLANPDEVKLGGKLQEITVLFADLEGFTSLSERVHPEELLRILNLYHALIVRIVARYDGLVDKFIGDGVMILYNTPSAQADHIARAVKTALHIQDELYWFHQKLDPAHRLKVNFGIHSGLAVVGNVGTDRQMNFTAVGDTVNVAARLQGIADNGRILVSELVYRETEEFVIGRNRGNLLVRGRSEPVAAWEISNSAFED